MVGYENIVVASVSFSTMEGQETKCCQGLYTQAMWICDVLQEVTPCFGLFSYENGYSFWV